MKLATWVALLSTNLQVYGWHFVDRGIEGMTLTNFSMRNLGEKANQAQISSS